MSPDSSPDSNLNSLDSDSHPVDSDSLLSGLGLGPLDSDSTPCGLGLSSESRVPTRSNTARHLLKISFHINLLILEITAY